MRTIRIALVVLLTAVAAASGSALASEIEKPQLIVLRGGRTAAIDIRLNHPIKIDTRLPSIMRDSITVETEGNFAGFLLESMPSHRLLLGVVFFPAMRSEDWPSDMPPIFNSWTDAANKPLSPGTYRLHLVTDGPTTLRIKADGLRRSRSYTPFDQSSVSTVFSDLVGAVPIATQLEERIPLDIENGAYVSVGMYVNADLGQRIHVHPCLTDAGGDCEEGDDQGEYTFTAPGASQMGVASFAHYGPGRSGNGGREALYKADAVGVIKKALAFALVLPTS